MTPHTKHTIAGTLAICLLFTAGMIVGAGYWWGGLMGFPAVWYLGRYTKGIDE